MTLSRRAIRRAVLGLLIVAFAAGAFAIWRSGAVTPTSVKAWLVSLGPSGPVLFVGAMMCGTLIGLPGIAFVVGCRLAFGHEIALIAGYVGGVLTTWVPFLVVRLLRRGAVSPWRPRQRHLARAFALLETHPLRAVILLRLIMWFNPPLSYALALAPVRTRDYLVGCAVGIAPVVAVAVLGTGWLL